MGKERRERMRGMMKLGGLLDSSGNGPKLTFHYFLFLEQKQKLQPS
jgi:hypothetical protein